MRGVGDIFIPIISSRLIVIQQNTFQELSNNGAIHAIQSSASFDHRSGFLAIN